MKNSVKEETGLMKLKSRNYDEEATYQIRVPGILDASWSDWFDGFAITVDVDENETELIGSVKDQADLHGILDKLNGLGLPIVLVKKVGGEHESHV